MYKKVSYCIGLILLTVVFSYSSTNAQIVPATKSAAKATARFAGKSYSRGGKMLHSTYKGGRWVTRKTWDGTKWVSRQVWVGTKKVGSGVRYAFVGKKKRKL